MHTQMYTHTHAKESEKQSQFFFSGLVLSENEMLGLRSIQVGKELVWCA